MKQLFLLMIDGMTGAGKTTVSTLLSKRIPRVATIGMDRVKKFVSDFERGERDNQIARDIVFEMSKKYLDYGISVIIEQPFESIDEIKKYEYLAKERSASLYKFQLFATPELALERVINRQKNTDNKVPENRIVRNISLFEDRSNEGFIIMDTSNISSEDAANKISEEMNIT